jgi:hypothetical protein
MELDETMQQAHEQNQAGHEQVHKQKHADHVLCVRTVGEHCCKLQEKAYRACVVVSLALRLESHVIEGFHVWVHLITKEKS